MTHTQADRMRHAIASEIRQQLEQRGNARGAQAGLARDLSKRLGKRGKPISQQTINAISLGGSVGYDVAQRFAEALGTTVDALIAKHPLDQEQRPGAAAEPAVEACPRLDWATLVTGELAEAGVERDTAEECVGPLILRDGPHRVSLEAFRAAAFAVWSERRRAAAVRAVSVAAPEQEFTGVMRRK